MWAAEMEYADVNTALGLKTVKRLSEGYPGTFDNPEREHVADDVIIRTLPYLPATLCAMVKLQRLTGMRPSEVFNMRVGQIDRNADSGLWLYRVPHHKTEKKVKWKKIIPLGLPEQKLIAPYLEGKSPEASVFSPRTAMQERKGTDKPMTRYGEFYNKDSYRTAVARAIEKANRLLPDGENPMPTWSPYSLRHAASSAMEVEVGFDESQALLDHTTPNTTTTTAHSRATHTVAIASTPIQN
jgi:integrase